MSDKPPFVTSMKASSSVGNISSRKKRVSKIDLESRGALAHLESLKGRVSPEFQKSPAKRPVNSPNHQLKSSFEFSDPPATPTKNNLTTVYMTDYCHCTSPAIF